MTPGQAIHDTVISRRIARGEEPGVIAWQNVPGADKADLEAGGQAAIAAQEPQGGDCPVDDVLGHRTCTLKRGHDEYHDFAGRVAAGETADVRAELAKVQRGAQTLGMVVTRQARDLYAMHIDVSRGDLEAVAQRVLAAIPDCDDNEPAEQWNGTETGSEWLERTREDS